MSKELTGKIIKFDDLKHVGQNNKPFISIVVETDDKYPQKIPVQAWSDLAEKISNDFHLHDAVKVSYNLRGNEYNGKYYANVEAWKIERA